MAFLKRMMGWACAGWFIFMMILIAPIAFPLAGLCYLTGVVLNRGSQRMRQWAQALRNLAKEME
jgi:hypothetical protein